MTRQQLRLADMYDSFSGKEPFNPYRHEARTLFWDTIALGGVVGILIALISSS